MNGKKSARKENTSNNDIDRHASQFREKIINKTKGSTKISNGVNKVYVYFIIAILTFSVILFMGWIPQIGNKGEELQRFRSAESSYDSITIFSADGCSCCHEYVNYLDQMGYDAEREAMNTVRNLKEDLGIPEDSYSCHTARYGSYFIEGHVPTAAISKLMNERPDIDGIALPDMPQGSPGMGGVQDSNFDIQAIKNGAVVGIFISL